MVGGSTDLNCKNESPKYLQHNSRFLENYEISLSRQLSLSCRLKLGSFYIKKKNVTSDNKPKKCMYFRRHFIQQPSIVTFAKYLKLKIEFELIHLIRLQLFFIKQLLHANKMKYLKQKPEKELLQIPAGCLPHVVTLLSSYNNHTNYRMYSLNVDTLLLYCNSPPD